jgi:hypothetical protein
MLGLGNSLVIGGVVPEVLPSDIDNLGIWLKNDTGVATGQWDDSSGNARHAVQGTGTQQASVSDGGLDFSSADPEDFYRISSTTSSLIEVKHPNAFTLAVVLKREGGASDNNVIFSTTSSNNFIGILSENNITTHTASSNFTGEPWANNEKLLLTITKDTSGNLLFFKNGASQAITSGAETATATSEFLLDYLGATRVGTAANDKHFDGIIYELVLYTSALTGSDLTNLNSYLTGKFGL